MRVTIFGAGISGLTAAHYLSKQGFKVTVFEKTDSCGGVAKSAAHKKVVSSEMSWRGFGPYYHNFYRIAKEIPNLRGTVRDSMSRPVEFISPGTYKDDLRPKTNFRDYAFMASKFVHFFLTDKRRLRYSTVDFVKMVQGRISRQTSRRVISMLGPGLGFNLKRCSLFHVGKFLELKQPVFFKKNKNGSESWIRHNNSMWSVLKGPTNTEWFDPWYKELRKQGVRFYFEKELVELERSGNRITNCQIKSAHDDKISRVESDYYLCATDPFHMNKIIQVSDLQNVQNLSNFHKIVADGEDHQIGFQILFKGKISLEHSLQVLNLPESEFGITISPQDQIWDSGSEILKHHSLWSGTITCCNQKGRVFKKAPLQLSKEQLIEEIKEQIFRSSILRDIVESHSAVSFTRDSVEEIAIWKSWTFHEKTGCLQSSQKKWVTDLQSELYRPDQVTGIKNLFLAGAYTRNSVSIYSMEGAVESGIRAAQGILDQSRSGVKLPLYQHEGLKFLSVFKKIDNFLFRKNLPSVVSFIILGMLLAVLLKVTIPA